MHDWPDATGRYTRETVDTTMAEARRLIADGAPAPFWVQAGMQTAGRGRRGRVWAMPEGNFAATLVLTPPQPVSDWALRSFTMSLALYDAVDALTGRSDLLKVKWPNDVLLEGRKLAGILLESDGDALTIGVGVNLVAGPPRDALDENALEPTSVLESTGQRVAPTALLDALATAHDRWETLLRAEGFAPIRAAWLERAANLGRPVTARMPGRTVAGRFETIDETGAIVIDTGAGRVTLAAADLHFA